MKALAENEPCSSSSTKRKENKVEDSDSTFLVEESDQSETLEDESDDSAVSEVESEEEEAKEEPWITKWIGIGSRSYFFIFVYHRPWTIKYTHRDMKLIFCLVQHEGKLSFPSILLFKFQTSITFLEKYFLFRVCRFFVQL